MNIQTPVFGRIQNGLGQDQTICHDNCDICFQRYKIGKGLVCANALGITHDQTKRLSLRLNWAWAIFLATACRARWLGIDCNDIVTCINKRFKHRNRKIRCSHKDYTHYSLAVACRWHAQKLMFYALCAVAYRVSHDQDCQNTFCPADDQFGAERSSLQAL